MKELGVLGVGAEISVSMQGGQAMGTGGTSGCQRQRLGLF